MVRMRACTFGVLTLYVEFGPTIIDSLVPLLRAGSSLQVLRMEGSGSDGASYSVITNVVDI